MSRRATAILFALCLPALAGPALAQSYLYEGDAYVTAPSYDAPSRTSYDPRRLRPLPPRGGAAAYYGDPYGDDYDGGYAGGDIYDDYGQATGRTRQRAAPSASAGSVAPRVTRETVPYDGAEPAGTVIVETGQRKLYLVTGRGEAIRYGVGVGREGFGWKGVQTITSKREWPSWTPPAEMLRRRPDLPRYMQGGIDNPLGARAMYLGSTLYRIHGSNEPESIGSAVSSGCIRMTNEDVTDLFERVRVGTRVVVR